MNEAEKLEIIRKIVGSGNRCPCGKPGGECQAWERNGQIVCPLRPRYQPQ